MTEKTPVALKPGEKGFTLVFLAAALFIFAQALILWRDKPGIAGPAAVPLLASGLMVILLIVQVILNAKKPSEAPENVSVKETCRLAFRYVLSLDGLFALGAIAAYCALLALGAPFYLVTPVFLWGLTTFFSRGSYLKNLLPAALCTAFVYVVFGLLFRVAMP